MSASFPADQYAAKRDVWLGYNSIVLPTVRKSLDGILEGKRVLDIGCGNGHFSKKFLEWSADSVLGIDNSKQMIEKCVDNYGKEEKLSYFWQGIDDFVTEKKFDMAIAFFVFQFLDSVEKLRKAFQNTYTALNDVGILVAIVPNGVPNYNPSTEEGKKFGAAVVVPDSPLQDGLPLTINFYNDDVVSGSSMIHFYFKETYQHLLLEAGFRRVEWSNPTLDPDYVQKYGEEYFKSYMTPPKDLVFKAFK